MYADEVKRLVNQQGFHLQLLQEITNEKNKIQCKNCLIYCMDGKVNFPLFLLKSVSSIICTSLADLTCCELLDEIVIIIPFISVTALNTLKQLVITGKCANLVNEKVLGEILCLCPDLNVFKIEYMPRRLPTMKNKRTAKFQNILGNNNNNLSPCKPKFQNVLGVKNFQSVNRTKTQQHEIDPNESLCHKSCKFMCYKVIRNWSDEDMQALRIDFKADKIIDVKRKLLYHLIVQDRVNMKETMFYKLKGLEFCDEFFAHLIGCSSVHIVSRVRKDFLSGTRFYMHGNSGSLKASSASVLTAISWLKCFSECYGQYSPEENVTVLCYWLSKQLLYKMYLDETVGVHISQSAFYELFSSTFGPNRIDKTLPWIRISKYSTHSVCKICVALNTHRRQCKTEAELQANIDAKNKHRENFGQARRKIEEIKQLALSFPHDHLFIQIDSMDNSKSYLPRYLENSKDQIQKERLPTKITGCTMYSSLYNDNRKVLFYLNHDIFENASNMIITLIYQLLLQFINDHNFLPR